MSQRKKRNFSQESETEESLWETLEDIETIFEKELKDLKEISSAGIIHPNSEHNNGNHFEEDESLIWNCGLCGSYYFKGHLQFSNHLLEHHSVDERKRKTQNVYGCLSCGNGFKDLQVLENHLLCEELCQKDYDKALLALYQSHSVPRFFAPLHLRCQICQDRFDELYRLLQYFPNCNHLENNDWKRKSSGQGVVFPQPRLRENGSHHPHASKDTTGIKDKKTSKPSSKTLTKVLDSLQDEINLTSPMDCADDQLFFNEVEHFNNHLFRSNTSIKDSIHDSPQSCEGGEQEQNDDDELDSLISMSSIKSKMIKLNSKKKSKATEVAESCNSVCHGFNGAKWIHSKPPNRVKNSKKVSRSKTNKFSTILNLDGTFDEDLDIQSSIEVIDIKDDEEESILECTSKTVASFSQPCLDCKILNFESRNSFIFHQIFRHDKSYCAHCDLIFETFSHLQNHNEKVRHTFPCDRCKKVFSDRFALSSHSREFHDEFPCSFCNLILTKDSMEDHYTRSHHLKMTSTKEFRIISEISSETATCSFCRRKKPFHKIFNHLQNWHHFSSPLLLELLVNSGFTFDLQAKSSSITDMKPSALAFSGLQNDLNEEVYSLEFDDKCLSHKFPKGTYTCPIEDCESKERIDKDYGLHLIIHHNLKYCYSCDHFLKNDYEVESHNSHFHANAFRCSQCKTHFDNIFSLLDHRIQSHGLITCCLCNNVVFMHKKPFTDHLHEFHGVSKSWCERFDIFQIYRQSLVTVCTSLSKMRCNLCQDNEFDLSNCGSLRIHLSSEHNFSAFDLFFSSYDGQKGFNLSSISSGEADGPSKEDQSICYITDKDVNVVLEDHQSNHEDAMVCNRNFESSSELQSHANELHPKKTLRCDFCPMVMSSLNGMKNHLLKVHKSSILVSEKYGHKCTHCKQTFWSLGERRAHINEEHKNVQGNRNKKEANCGIKELEATINDKEENPMDQSIVSKAEKESSNIETNLHQSNESLGMKLDNEQPTKSKSKIRKSKCKLCSVILTTAKVREEHYKNVHNGLLPFTCNECYKGFSTKSSLVNHKSTHGNFKCPVCSKEFFRRDSFNEHQLIHSGPRYICPRCPKEFVQKSNLRRHIRIHLGIKPFKCKHCQKAFSDSAAMKAHELIHQRIKVTCGVCGQTFTRQQKLNYHMRIHTGNGLLICDVCQKVFTNSYSMKRHLLTHSQSKKFTCSLCSETFKSRKKLAIHLKQKENIGKTCKECGLEFHSETELNAHVLGFHTESKKSSSLKGYKCRHCESSFNSLSDIREHLLLKHGIKQDLPFHFINGFRNEQEDQLYKESSFMIEPQELNCVQCMLCGGIIKNLRDFGCHLKTMHNVSCLEENGALTCPICNLEIGYQPIDLNMHIRINHEDSVSPIVDKGDQNNEETGENETPEKEIIPTDFLESSIAVSEIKIDPEYIESK